MQRLVGGILLWNDRILLGKRSAERKSYPGVWDIIGGHCEQSESFEKALFRELYEEIGIVPNEYELLTRVDNRPDFLFEIYLIAKWSGEVINRCPEEHSELGWFTVGQARQLPLAAKQYLLLFDSIAAKHP